MTDKEQDNNLHRYLNQQMSGEELYEEQCNEFLDSMDTHINSLVEYFNIRCSQYDIDRDVLREIIIDDIKEQL